jgi:hypothetical protein
MERGKSFLQIASILLVIGTTCFDAIALSGRLRISSMQLITISNSLIALTIGTVLGWGSVAFRKAGATSAGITTLDRLIVVVLGAASLAYLAAAVFNLGDAHWLR